MEIRQIGDDTHENFLRSLGFLEFDDVLPILSSPDRNTLELGDLTWIDTPGILPPPPPSESSKDDEEEKLRETRRKEKQREAVKRHRKRKLEELQLLKETAKKLSEEKALLERQLKLSAKSAVGEAKDKCIGQIPLVKRDPSEWLAKRRGILQRIAEAWNLGGIDDMEEIAEEVYHPEATLLNPDISEELSGVNNIMKYWGTLMNAFPDGLMVEYEIKEEDAYGDKMRVDWVFSGTHVKPFSGIPPQQKQVSIRGSSFVSFEGMQVVRMVITWNYREAIMNVMGAKLTQQES